MFVICFSPTARHGFCIVVMFYFKIFPFLFCHFWFVHLSVSFPLVIFHRCLFCLHHLCSPPVSSSQSHCGRLLCSVISPSLVLPFAFPLFSFGLSSFTVDLFVLDLLDCFTACSFFGIMLHVFDLSKYRFGFCIFSFTFECLSFGSFSFEMFLEGFLQSYSTFIVWLLITLSQGFLWL